MKAAVLGSPISHSLSPVLHRAAYRALGLTGWTYDAIECDEPGLPAVLDGCGQDWAGLSLTMPLKRAVLPLLDTAEPLVADVGCANTVIFAAGARQGHNTDVPGMVNALTAAGVSGSGPVLLLGAGATACSALAAMRALGVGEVTVAVRDRQRAADLLAVARRLEMTVRLADFGRQPRPAAGMCSYRPFRLEPPISTHSSSFAAIWSPRQCSTSCTTRGRPAWPSRPRKPVRA